MLNSAAERIKTVSGAPPKISTAERRPAAFRCFVLAVAALMVLPLAGQAPGVSPSNPDGQVMGPGISAGSIEGRMEAKRIAQLNQIREKSMKSDAEKLLRLARELNEDASAGGTVMSASERMHKAAEIEKLAKAVKEKMTYAIGEPSDVMTPFSIQRR